MHGWTAAPVASHARTSVRIAAVSLVLSAGLGLVAPPGALAAHGLSAPVLVSGPDPLPPFGAPGACGSEPAYQGWEQEAAITVDPANRNRLVAGWIQDYADAIGVAASTDGGESWTRAFPHTAACTWPLGQTPPSFTSFNSAFDPSLSTGPSRLTRARSVTYLTSVLANARDNSAFAVIVNRSTDGGTTWSEPTVLDQATATAIVTPAGPATAGEYLDWSNVAADQVRPDRAYAIWQRGDSTFTSRSTFVSHTSDGGLHWSAPVAGPPTPEGMLQAAGRLLVMPDGSVVDVLVEIPVQPAYHVTLAGGTTIVASRSTDQGTTWSAPITVAAADQTRYVVPGVGVGADGAISVVWQRSSLDESTFDMLHTRSTDMGATWSRPAAIEIGVHGPRSTADVAVSPGGTIGVLSYDHRNDTAWYDHRGDAQREAPTVTDAWAHTSADGGATWAIDHVAGPFDQTSVPAVGGEAGEGGFLGDYQGIAPLPDGFAMAFALATPLPGAAYSLSGPPSDIFSSRLRLR